MPPRNFLQQVSAIVENCVSGGNRNTILRGVIKPKQLRKHQILHNECSNNGRNVVAARRELFRQNRATLATSVAASMCTDNFVTGVQMFLHTFAGARIAICNSIFAHRVLQFTSSSRPFAMLRTNSGGILSRALCTLNYCAG
jgi:ribosomal protein L34